MGNRLRKRLHIATLGLYANERVDHVVLKRGADRVVVIYTKENEEELADIRARYHHYGLPLDARKVEPWSYEEVLSEILEVVLDYPNHEVEFNISCGTRVMTTAAYMAALFTDSPVFFCHRGR